MTTNSVKFDQAIVVTRNNPWLLKCTNEMLEALAARGIRIALIAYTGFSPGWINQKDLAPQLRPFRNWVDGYFDTTYIPWVQQKTHETYPDPSGYRSYLDTPGYFTLDQLAHKHGLFSAVRLDLGPKGRAQYHQAIIDATAYWSTPDFESRV